MIETVIHSLYGSFYAVLVFLVGFLVVPINRGRFSLDARLFLGLFTTLVYLFSQLLFLDNQGNGFPSYLLAALLGGVSVIACFFACITSDKRKELILSLWYAGVFSVCFALQLYVYVALLLFFALLFELFARLMREYQLESFSYTLIIECERYQTVERVLLLLEIMKAKGVETSVKKEETFICHIQYGASTLAQHIITKNLFGRSDINSITIHDG